MSPLDVFFATLSAVLWGGNFVAAKVGTAYFPPFFLTFLRFAVVVAVALPFVKVPPRAQMKSIFYLSTVLGTFHFALIFAGLRLKLDIATAALTGQMGVPFACLFGAIFLGDKLGAWRLSGMVISFLGMMVITGAPNILEHLAGFYATLASAFFWGAGNMMIKRIKNVQSFQLLTWMGLFALPQLLLISLIVEGPQWSLLPGTPLPVAAAGLYSAFFSTIVAYGLWYHLLHKYSVTLVTPFALLVPAFGIAAGQLFFAEQLTWQVWLGGMITITGVAIIVLRKPKIMEMGQEV